MPNFIQKNKGPFNSIKNLVVNRHLYIDFENNERKEVNSPCNFVSVMVSKDNSNDSYNAQEIDDSRVKLKDNMLEGKFVSKNVINLSQRQLSQKFRFFQKNLSLHPHLRG